MPRRNGCRWGGSQTAEGGKRGGENEGEGLRKDKSEPLYPERENYIEFLFLIDLANALPMCCQCVANVLLLAGVLASLRGACFYSRSPGQAPSGLDRRKGGAPGTPPYFGVPSSPFGAPFLIAPPSSEPKKVGRGVGSRTKKILIVPQEKKSPHSDG